ncbi:hypothetical protein TWF506_005420 [Arthrobotrys conoides]|uniref:Uncharacterized protein n=1 Tax=Arthrobotrys conoides TaxID=74498 RepID=A0AAN8RW04_9PEZI
MFVSQSDKFPFLLRLVVLFLSFFNNTSSIPQREVTLARFHYTSIITKWETRTSVSIRDSYRITEISTVISADPKLCKGYPIPTALQRALILKVCGRCPLQTITDFGDPITSHAEPWAYGLTTILQWWVFEFWEWAFEGFQTAVYHVSQHGKPAKWASYAVRITLRTNSKVTLGVLVTYNTTSFIPHRTRVTIHNLEGGYHSTNQVTRAPTTITFIRTTRFQKAIYITITQITQLTWTSTITDGSSSLIKTSSIFPLPLPTKVRCTTTLTHTNKGEPTLILTSETLVSVPLAINIPGDTQRASRSCYSSKLTGAPKGSEDGIVLRSTGLQSSMVLQSLASHSSRPSSVPSLPGLSQTDFSPTAVPVGSSSSSVPQSTESISVPSVSDSISTITPTSTSWYEMVTQTIYSGNTSRTSMTIGPDGNPTAIIVLPTGLGGIRFTTVFSGSTVSETTVVGPGGVTTVIEISPTGASQVGSSSEELPPSSIISPEISSTTEFPTSAGSVTTTIETTQEQSASSSAEFTTTSSTPELTERLSTEPAFTVSETEPSDSTAQSTEETGGIPTPSTGATDPSFINTIPTDDSAGSTSTEATATGSTFADSSTSDPGSTDVTSASPDSSSSSEPILSSESLTSLCLMVRLKQR